jgi:CIC family chloride channel protein
VTDRVQPVVDQRPIPWWALALLAIVVGIIAGFGAVVFRAMIGGFHNLLFFGHLSMSYDANVHTPVGPWGMLAFLVPVVGAVGVAFIVGTFAPEAKGHGVPEVMDAIYYRDGKIRPVVAVVKSIASALSIGSGGSVGREGPIVQIGAAFGSTLGQLITMPAHQRIILVAAGAGAGIAATFNSPVSGIAFAVELMLPAITARSVLAVALATIVSTRIGHHYFGTGPSFSVPALAVLTPDAVPIAVLPWFVLCGVAAGLLATVMIHAIYWFEDRFDALPGNYYTRHMLGMLVVGLIFCAFMVGSMPVFGQLNQYYVQGVGYATILDMLRGDLTAPVFLLVLVGAKLLVTCLTLGSGASGGVFSPSLFLGGALGVALGGILHRLIPGMDLTPAHFCVATMAGMVAGTTGAVITGILIVFEMTWDYGAILPTILTATTAYAVRQHLSPASIYTLKLLRRGHVVPQGLQAWMGGVRRARDVMSSNFVAQDGDRAVEATGGRAEEPSAVLVIVRDGRIARVAASDGAGALSHIVVAPDDRLSAVLHTIDETGARVAVVTRSRESTSPGDVLGVITDREVAAAVRSTARLME